MLLRGDTCALRWPAPFLRGGSGGIVLPPPPPPIPLPAKIQFKNATVLTVPSGRTPGNLASNECAAGSARFLKTRESVWSSIIPVPSGSTIVVTLSHPTLSKYSRTFRTRVESPPPPLLRVRVRGERDVLDRASNLALRSFLDVASMSMSRWLCDCRLCPFFCAILSRVRRAALPSFLPTHAHTRKRKQKRTGTMTKATRPSTTLTATRADSVVLSCATPGSLRQALFSIAETHAISRRHERTTKYENKILRSREFRPPPGPRSVHTLHLCRDCISVVSVSPTRELSPLALLSLSLCLLLLFLICPLQHGFGWRR